MDAKASAKSKRAHSVQAKRAHSHHNSKKKPPQPTLNHPESSPLPSNWDRYGDDDGNGGHADSKTPQISSSVSLRPRTKGSDYSLLISQAQSYARAPSHPSNPHSFTSFDHNAFSDYHQGLGSMISVKGNSLLSWIQDDDFVVDESAASGFEASFLSMDLNALTSQLEKVDLSQRLYVERDLLSEDMFEQPNEVEIGASEDESALATDTKKNPDKNFIVSSNIYSGKRPEDVHCHDQVEQMASERILFPTAQSSNSDHLVRDSKTLHQDGRNAPQSLTHLSEHSDLEKSSKSDAFSAEADVDILLSTTNKATVEKTSEFKPVAVEAELDMLLNSLGETNLASSLADGVEPRNTLMDAVYCSSMTLLKQSLTSLNDEPQLQVTDYCKLTNNALNNVLDDLLVSKPVNHDHAASQPLERMPPVGLPPFSGSKTFDDFDSWLDTL